VTVCIAAKATYPEPFIVTVTDMQIGHTDSVLHQDVIPSKDVAKVKFQILDNYWGFLFSTNEIGYINPIMEKAKFELEKFSGRRTLGQAKQVLQNAYREVRTDVIFARFLSQYGYSSMEEFREKPGFSPEVIGGLMAEMDAFDLGVTLLLYGFDEHNWPHFVQIDNPGEAKDRDDFGYWAIGSGHRLALSALNQKRLRDHSIEEFIYRCCEAKFVAEFDPSVGDATAVFIWYPDGTRAVLIKPDADKMREIYEQTRGDPIPAAAASHLTGRLEYWDTVRDTERRRREIVVAKIAGAGRQQSSS